MTEKRLVTIDSCEYCPYLEKVKLRERIINNPLIDADYYKCNKTLLCVENGKIYLKKPLELLFKYCSLPDSDDDDYFEEDIGY